MNLRDQLTSVENQLAEEKSNLNKNPELIAHLEERQAQLTAQITEQEAVQQVRIQVQEEKVESIALPYDFNEVFADPRANEMIIELIKDFQRQAYADHNTEVEELIAEHKNELKVVSDNLAKAETENHTLNIELDDLTARVNHLTIERDDALSKRDAAVREKEGIETLLDEKQEHIDKLRDEIAIGAKAAINVTSISPSDRLAALVQESKSAKIKSSLELAMERTEPVRGKIEVVAPPKALEEATFPGQASDPANIGLDDTETSQLPAANTEVGFPPIPTAQAPDVHSGHPVDTGVTSTTGTSGSQTVEERFEALERRVVELEKVCNINEEAA